MTHTSEREPLHPVESITSFLLVRHGHTEATEQGRLYTDPAAELTPQGMAQASAVADWIHEKKPDVVLCSTARRVRSTAAVISRQIGVEALPVEGLNEWHVGEWEGLTYWDVKKDQPEVYKQWSSDPIMNRPPGGESVADMFERTRSKIGELIDQYDGKTVCLITHAGIIRSALIYALEMDIRNFWRFAIPVGSITRIDFSRTFATVHYVALQP